VIIISKAILSATTAQRVRELVSGLDPAPLWDLALELAAQPGLRVSVITYQDGSTELEVLAVGQPGLHDAVDMIQAVMRDVSSP
jgi:hypothetical protein